MVTMKQHFFFFYTHYNETAFSEHRTFLMGSISCCKDVRVRLNTGKYLEVKLSLLF